MKALGFLVCVILVVFLLYNTIRHFLINQKSKLIGLIRRYPLLPFPQDGFKEFEATEKLKTLVPQARIQVCRNYTNRQECWNGKKQAIHKMNEIMRWIVKWNKKQFDGRVHGDNDIEKIEDLVPNDARLISIKMDGFKHGEMCHEFEPIDGTIEGSYFTYQMFGDNRIQVTNYVEDNISYVAGFCIYIDSPWTSGNYFRLKFIEDFFNTVKLPIRVRTRNTARVIVKNENQVNVQHSDQKKNKEKGHEIRVGVPEHETVYMFETENRLCNSSSPIPSEVSLPEEGGPSSEMTIKWCPKLRRNIMSKIEEDVVIHEEWDPKLERMKNKECQLCTDVLHHEEPPAYSSLA
ncbi:hypothetical protein GCK72_002040 [Caenorhabditis remanei]|uniref:Uncharacterized protein n=1 Tax=Caenorhabditis remanei TaxID=31234 RepID=A0A6A5HWK9_CAERE|nr:hypothetical protein GCK72_002040 [Caenorhabditis remanei]KAF1770222.1 hypothetical protein GCK72_002040 [Caenorhabditis remanei]